MLERYNRVLRKTSRPLFRVAKRKGTLEKLLAEAKEYAKSCEFCAARCGNPLPKARVLCAKGQAREPLAAPSLELYFKGGIPVEIAEQHPEQPSELATPSAVAAWIDRNAKSHRALVISGDPSHHIPFILSVLLKVKSDLPVVLAAHPYFSEVASGFFKPIIDLYSFAFLFSDKGCASHLAGIGNYPEVARRACAEADMSEGVIVRIPVLPAHIECDAKETVRWLAENMSDCAVRVLKEWKHEMVSQELARKPSITELHEVAKAACMAGLSVLE